MMRKLLFTLIVLFILPVANFAQWISLDNNKASNTPPEVTIIKDDNTSTIIKIELSGFNLKELITEGNTYQSVDLLNEIFTTKAGSPELPYIAKVLAIPDQSGVSIEVLETSKVQIFSNLQVQPARLSWYEGDPETPYEKDSKAYMSDDIYPKEYVSLDPPAIFRDFRIARFSVYPIRYVPAKEELHVVSSITVRINYGSGEVVNPKTSKSKGISPSFAKLYSSFIFNYKSVLESQFNNAENGREVMLCIMPDEFVASFQVYADWKRESGTDVHVTSFTDIGANATNPITILDHVSDAYFNWEFPPTYVLIIGDNGIFPKKIISYDYSFAYDNYFVEVDGNDFFPEMMIGRFTNQGDYRMQVMINKFMSYEKEPYVANTDWYKKAICCSNNEYESQVYTKRYAAEIMVADGGFTVDTMMSDGYGSGCTMNISDITSIVNEGRSYLNYRGEGWSSGWWASCYSLGTSNISNLNNGAKLTFVTSIGCGVAMFDANGGNCFGEEWVQLGSLTDIRGGVAFVGPTSNTHTTYNNKLDRGIYEGMFQEGMDTPGEALLRGKLNVYNIFGSDPWVEYHYRVFIVLGDPSIHIWKDVPLEVNVSHPSFIAVGYNQPEVTVTFASTGLPVANAQVCLTGDDVFVTATTNSLGKAFIGLTPLSVDTLTITVRGGNVIPYQGTMEILQAAEHVAPVGDHTMVDIDGNTDGLVNPNENCNISFTLKNWGTSTAENVQATISSADTNVTIITTTANSYGDIVSGGSVGSSPFQIYVEPDCPVGHVIAINLNVTTNSNSWIYYSNDSVKGCDIIFTDYLIVDTTASLMNYRMDPGETVKLYLTVMNIGEDNANSVNGILTCIDPWITIGDDHGSFGTIQQGASKLSANDFFEVTVNPLCPGDYMVEYSLHLYTQGNLYPYEKDLIIFIPVSMMSQSDFTGPDNYGYYAYANSDSLFEQAPEYDWFEINQIGTSINATSSEYTLTVDLPFNFKYYGVEYQQLRISTDGWIAFGGGSQTMYENLYLPSNNSVNCMVAPFWDDLYSQYNESGDIFYYSDTANHRFIIEYDGIGHWNDNAQKEVFQIILSDTANYMTPTGDGEILFMYKEVFYISSSTVGIENHNQDDGIQYLYNGVYDVTGNTIREEFALKFTTEPPYIHVEETFAIGQELILSGNTLNQNYPNPFERNTWINYSLSENTYVSLSIFNLNGQLVRTLQSGMQPTGEYTVRWNGTDNSGKNVSSGMYLYRLQTDGFDKAMKMFKL